MPERPAWIGIIVRTADGRTQTIELTDEDNLGCIDGVECDIKLGEDDIHAEAGWRWPRTGKRKTEFRITTSGWSIYRFFDEPVDNPFEHRKEITS